MEHEIMKVEGMHCHSCEQRVEDGVGNLDGVTSVDADYDAGTVDITYDPKRVSIEAIHSVIESLGYEVVA